MVNGDSKPSLNKREGFLWKTTNIRYTLISGRLNHGYMRDVCEMFTFFIRATPVAGFLLTLTITAVRTSAFRGTGHDINPRNPVYLSRKFTSPYRINAFRFGCLVKVVDIRIKIFPLDYYRPQNLNYFLASLGSKLDWSSSRPNTHVMQTRDEISAVARFTNNGPSDYHLPVYSPELCRVCVKAVLLCVFHLTDSRPERLYISVSHKWLRFRISNRYVHRPFIL